MTCCGYSCVHHPYVSLSHTQTRTHAHTKTDASHNNSTLHTHTHAHTWPGPCSPPFDAHTYTHTYAYTLPSPWRVWQRLMMAYHLMPNWALHGSPPNTHTHTHTRVGGGGWGEKTLMHIYCSYTKKMKRIRIIALVKQTEFRWKTWCEKIKYVQYLKSEILYSTGTPSP